MQPTATARREIDRWLSFARRTTRFWPTLLGTLVLAAVACALLLYSTHPAYRSETVLLYSQGVGSTDPSDPAGPRNPTARLKELLLSRRELSRIASQFSLYPKTRTGYGLEDAVDELKKDLEFRAPGGDTFSIAYRGTSPGEAQRVTAALARMVIDGDAALRKTQAEFALDFLATEKTSTGDALRAAEHRLAVFMGEHRRFALDATPLAAGAAIRATLPGAVPSVPVSARLSGDRRASATNTPSSPTTPTRTPAAVEDAGERGRAAAALAAARANLSEQLVQVTPAHPDVKAAQGAVERATVRLEALAPETHPAAVAVVAPALAPPTHGELSAPRQRDAKAAPATSARASPGSSDIVKLETDWFKLTRGVTEARRRLDQVEVALFKADIQASFQRSGSGVQISVIDPAYLPQRPLGMPTTTIVASCFAVGLLLGLIAAALRATLDDRIYDANDLGRTLPVLVQIPRFSSSARFHGAG